MARRKKSALEKLYCRYNRLYFGGTLPNPPEIKVKFGKTPDAILGYTCGDLVVISTQIRRFNCLVKLTLLHELVHVYLPVWVEPHGKRFQKEMKRLARADAFKELW